MLGFILETLSNERYEKLLSLENMRTNLVKALREFSLLQTILVLLFSLVTANGVTLNGVTSKTPVEALQDEEGVRTVKGFPFPC
ncbi:MAG: hypothetical protein ASUL_02464 [Candidatus Aramenus sulfurataquae]|jgi:hypothetical protein|uniref:Uncharacterized protein n=2 Tax=Candidatus Aramenus sulfurataquae TaxID=1326980 RepID=W7KKF4_9CREN|nr:MAG: hypothetical protein ASUL_02464 [Candidatus Aramenus sulfurataquae]MCL7344152.1 hypothetical protein [Candidatus Aramenus sulfurataquae]